MWLNRHVKWPERVDKQTNNQTSQTNTYIKWFNLLDHLFFPPLNRLKITLNLADPCLYRMRTTVTHKLCKVMQKKEIVDGCGETNFIVLFLINFIQV